MLGGGLVRVDFLATPEAKIILVKLLSEYEFALVEGKGRFERTTFHDCGFIGEHEKLMVRRREIKKWY